MRHDQKTKVKPLEHILGDEWVVKPAGGSTGEAYFAQSGHQKLFIKRNSSSFLAVLSAEGIVPKLLWTKRLENGDVITAQQWLQSRELKAFEMRRNRVASLLGKIHQSSELLYMFRRLGKKPLTAAAMLKELLWLQEKVTLIHQHEELLTKAFHYLMQNIEEIDDREKVVCHCDINHNNWLLTGKDELYLVDWEGAMIADPALDLGTLLYWYVPENEWNDWIQAYGMPFNDDLKRRMRWYAIAQTLWFVYWSEYQGKSHEKAQWFNTLENIL